MSRVLYDFQTTFTWVDGRPVSARSTGKFHNCTGTIAAHLPDEDHPEPWFTYSVNGRCSKADRLLVLAQLERERLLNP